MRIPMTVFWERDHGDVAWTVLKEAIETVVDCLGPGDGVDIVVMAPARRPRTALDDIRDAVSRGPDW